MSDRQGNKENSGARLEEKESTVEEDKKGYKQRSRIDGNLKSIARP